MSKPIKNSELSSLNFCKPFRKVVFFFANTTHLSMTTDEEYLRHECVEKCSSSLHIAVRTGNVDAIEILLETGSNLNGKDCMNRTPLHWAVFVINFSA